MLHARCYSKFLWVKYLLEDDSTVYNNIPVYCDNISVINLSKNFIQHLIEVRYHIMHDYARSLFELKFVKIDHQYAYTLTKILAVERLDFIKSNLHLVDFTND